MRSETRAGWDRRSPLGVATWNASADFGPRERCALHQTSNWHLTIQEITQDNAFIIVLPFMMQNGRNVRHERNMIAPNLYKQQKKNFIAPLFIFSKYGYYFHFNRYLLIFITNTYTLMSKLENCKFSSCSFSSSFSVLFIQYWI